MNKSFFLFFFLLFLPFVLADSSSWWDVIWHVGDATPPTTSDDYNGECVIDGAIILTLTCSDGVSGSGCNTIYARVAGESWAFSTSNPWTFSLWRDENIILEYYSIDNFGNIELVKAKEICFITTPKQTERYIAPYDVRIDDLTRFFIQGDARTTDSNRYFRPTDRRGSIINQGNLLGQDYSGFPLFYIFIALIIILVIIWWRT